MPVNHLVVVRRELAAAQPAPVAELLRLFHDAKAGSRTEEGGVDLLLAGRAALWPAADLASRYALEQGLLPRRLRVNEVWDGLADRVA